MEEEEEEEVGSIGCENFQLSLMLVSVFSEALESIML
jgi:hypothetical protein